MTDQRPPIPRAIWALGFVSLLMDVSSELIHSLLPVFMLTVLGMSAFTIGLIEAAAEATALMLKVFSGVVSDWWGKRKPLAVLGYGLGALSKPLFAMGLMLLWANDFRAVFWVAVIPACLAVALLFFGVQEPERHRPGWCCGMALAPVLRLLPAPSLVPLLLIRGSALVPERI